MNELHSSPPHGRVALITGGAGFIGSNLAHRLLVEGRRVLLFDNLSRTGVEQNLHWLRQTHGTRVQVEVGDIRDPERVRRAVACASSVFHFAAQVAVTTSFDAPLDDFEINARGTLNVLEALRALPSAPPLIFTSTNKVYGALDDLEMHETETRFEPADAALRANGIDETRPLDFHSPYGCSKGTADQYISDYARSYGMPTVVFRMSCVYGLHQMGNEDQGWVAHFLIHALEGRPLTIYGNGKQVRDILFIEDLVQAFMLAEQNAQRLSGQAFNIGGGAQNRISLLELIKELGRLSGRVPEHGFADWRRGDQRYYVSNTRKFQHATGWSPQVSVQEGLERLWRWLGETKGVGRRSGRSQIQRFKTQRLPITQIVRGEAAS